jgi:thioester reductase-like protein
VRVTSVFITGFPGYLASGVVERLLARPSVDSLLCLVEPRFEAVAQRRARSLGRGDPTDRASRLRLIAGDITRSRLGLPADALRGVTEIFHLAAAYDLGVSRELGLRVNVDGTRNVLDVAGECRDLERFHYVSTCYVSGRHPGVFRETDLDVGQRFNNYYEETKFLAEVEVQSRVSRGLPAAIYRPAIVVGDSRTGRTQKYDGPYPVIRLLLRQPTLAIMPVVGDPDVTRVNLVPSDFVLDAIDYLSGRPSASGCVYQLADPRPLTASELLEAVAACSGQNLIRVRLPTKIARAAIERVPGVGRLLGIPAAALDYFSHPTEYSTTNSRKQLRGSGIEVPDLRSYVCRLVDFVREKPELG